MNGTIPCSCSIHRRLIRCLCLLLTLGLTQGAVAHQRSESFSRWQYSGDTLSVRFTISEREASRLQLPFGRESLQALLVTYLAGRILVQNDLGEGDSGCAVVHQFRALRSRPGFVQAEAAWQCRELPGAVAIHAFFDLAAEHSHFASFESAHGFSQRLLTAENRYCARVGIDEYLCWNRW